MEAASLYEEIFYPVAFRPTSAVGNQEWRDLSCKYDHLEAVFLDEGLETRFLRLGREGICSDTHFVRSKSYTTTCDSCLEDYLSYRKVYVHSTGHVHLKLVESGCSVCLFDRASIDWDSRASLRSLKKNTRIIESFLFGYDCEDINQVIDLISDGGVNAFTMSGLEVDVVE